MKNSVEFNNGLKMPIIGLGTWQSPDTAELEKALDEALKCGYRHIDTAFAYQNETSIGKVLKTWLDSGKIKREELFITTKLPMIGMKPERVEEFLQKSLKALQLDFVDLYLIHSSVGLQYVNDTTIFPINPENGHVMIDKSTDLEAIWKSMESMVDKGLTKSIGISNFNSKQIERMVKCSRIKPTNLQVELHIYFQQKPLREFCKKFGITVCAYAPFGSPGRKELYSKRGMQFKDPNLLEDPVIKKFGEKYRKTAAQILLKFIVQNDVVVIPKSTSAERLKQNFQIFDFSLTSEEMKEIEALDKPDGRTFSMSAFAGVDQHPENPLTEPF